MVHDHMPCSGGGLRGGRSARYEYDCCATDENLHSTVSTGTRSPTTGRRETEKRGFRRRPTPFFREEFRGTVSSKRGLFTAVFTPFFLRVFVLHTAVHRFNGARSAHD